MNARSTPAAPTDTPNAEVARETSRTPPSPDGTMAPQDGGDVEGDLSLPHERDQTSHMTDGVPSNKVRQAAQDVERGLEDTSKGTEMDRAYKKQR